MGFKKQKFCSDNLAEQRDYASKKREKFRSWPAACGELGIPQAALLFGGARRDLISLICSRTAGCNPEKRTTL